MTTLIVLNHFHTTAAKVDPTRPLTLRRIKDIKRQLCPAGDCTCSDVLGARGPQLDGYRDLQERAERVVAYGQDEI
jgi:hypothetical protein